MDVISLFKGKEQKYFYMLSGNLKFSTYSPDLHLTFVAESVEGCFVNSAQPYCIQGKWLQVLIPADLLKNIIESFRDVETTDMKLPLVFDFQEKNLRFIINHLSPANVLR